MQSKKRGLFSGAGFSLIACLAAAVSTLGQTPSPSPTAEIIEDGYKITSSMELGVRGLSVNGDHDKFRSDLNYRPGVRIFDSSFLIENNNQFGGKLFDSALITSSGWGADPQGSFRFNMDKTSVYRFESNVRSVKYFNNLKNHAIIGAQTFPTGSQHRANTNHRFGDFDLTVFPESDTFRMRFGYSFNNTSGPGTNTIRFQGDEYQVNSNIKTRSHDLRFGVEGQVLGFNVGINYGHRIFRDSTRFFLDSFNLGNNPAATTSFLNNSLRLMPVNGTTDFATFYVQRTFAGKLDFTGRLIYSLSKSKTSEFDSLTGRVSNTGNFILEDLISVPGEARRPQKRANIGLTYRVTDDFRIWNTFIYDQFDIDGDNTLFERVRLANSSGVPLPSTVSNTSAYRTTDYRKFSNTTELDYQFSPRLGVHIGYRFTWREVLLAAIDRNLVTGATTRNTREDHQNQTNTFLAGAKIKPTKYWSIYVDAEVGRADNVFTRLSNNEVANFRLRSILRMKQFTVNFSGITKDNDSPGLSTAFTGNVPFPSIDTTLTAKTRIFSASVDWTPTSELTLSSGYTYNHQTSRANIIVPVGAPLFSSTRFLEGVSEYYMRDNYAFFDIHARPFKRVSIYASYRIDNDTGQGDRIETRPQDFINSYPIRFQMPEARVAFRLTRNLDWNVGYQYYSYREVPERNPFLTNVFPAQNYTAHLPYTSLRLSRPVGFGPVAADKPQASDQSSPRGKNCLSAAVYCRSKGLSTPRSSAP